MRRARHPGGVVISSGFGEEKSEEAAARDAELARDRQSAPAWSSPGPIRRGSSTRCGRSSRPSARCSTIRNEPLLPQEQPGEADRGQLPERRADLRVSVARPRPPVANSPTRSAPATRPCSRRTTISIGCSMPAAPTSFMCYLEGIRDTARFRAVADKAARAGKPHDRRQGRALRRRAPRRRLAYRRARPCRHGRRRDLPPSRHHPRRGPRPHGRCRDRLRLLPAAARQPGRGHHRLGRQRGVDGRHPVGARARTAGARGRTSSAASWRCCRPTPRRRTRSTRRRRRSARSATRRWSSWSRNPSASTRSC